MNFLITLNLFAKNQSSEVDYGIVSVIMSSFLGRRKLTNQKGKYAEEVTCVRINDCDSCVNCVCVPLNTIPDKHDSHFIALQYPFAAQTNEY